MERPIFKPVGTPVEQLDTPVLVVDLAVLERNIEAMHSFFRGRDAKLRPHVESHSSPAIAHKQMAAGGTVGGISVTTVGQADVFCASGFTDIFVANVIVTPPKITRLCALARHATMTVGVDYARNVADLSEAASASGVGLNVVVGVDTGAGLLGVEPGGPAVDLARAIRDADGLEFAGLMTYEGSVLTDDAEGLAAESRGRIQRVLNTRQTVEKAGMDVKVVSVGGTHNYEIAGAMNGVTQVPAGSYALMDQRLRHLLPQFRPAAKVMSTVASVPEPGVAITDGGQKAIGADTGLPAVEDLHGVEVKSLSAEHGNFTLNASAEGRLKLGDKVWVTPWDIGTCVNLHDYMHGVRDGVLEVVWEVAARGRYR
jgi:D-serine deaminase-like pyridoxal phosphate-dependent protein